ncbi:MAG: sigma-54-dependent Fis family transcriptional regulator, partial [Proteobacteria bacterium]|nr:sigma-54-dependent Fis family transcriptional regulator [Pseudomonadota bacterium]
PLRRRRDDIPLLASHFVSRHAEREGRPVRELSPEVMMRLQAQPWPGNVRELENLLERLVVLAEGEVIGPEALPPKMLDEAPLPEGEPEEELPALELPPGGLNLKHALEQIERRLIAQALEQAGGVKAQAASLLGLNRTTLVQKLKKLGGLRYRSGNRSEK